METQIKKTYLVFIISLLAFRGAYAQENRFNSELDKYCKTIIKEEFRTIPEGRKTMLRDIAEELSGKRYILFTCKTNSRRTVMLQVWAQTSLYYYGVFGKYAFSIGDTITSVYPGVAEVLKESGFYCTEQKNEAPNRYVISISEEYPVNLLSSKNEVGTIDTAKGVVVNICFDNEQSSIAANKGHLNLPYQSPTLFEKTSQEKQKYRMLNHQVAVEMLYLAETTKRIISDRNDASGY